MEAGSTVIQINDLVFIQFLTPELDRLPPELGALPPELDLPLVAESTRLIESQLNTQMNNRTLIQKIWGCYTKSNLLIPLLLPCANSGGISDGVS